MYCMLWDDIEAAWGENRVTVVVGTVLHDFFSAGQDARTFDVRHCCGSKNNARLVLFMQSGCTCDVFESTVNECLWSVERELDYRLMSHVETTCLVVW
jgi:hypothetical protein